MVIRRLIFCSLLGIVASSYPTSLCFAQTMVLSAAPPQVEYQYQLHYPRLWGWPGPGLSLGGSLPTNGREGISSFYGLPMPVPLGGGVYVNPFAYSARLPGPLAFGLAQSAPSPNMQNVQTTPNSLPMGQNPGINPAAGFVPPSPPAERKTETIRRFVQISSLESLQKSHAIVSFGDEKLIMREWTQAYVNYRNATVIADDLADAHARLGFVCIIMNRLPEAAQEFKRALFFDPTIGNSGESMISLLGMDSRAIFSEMKRNVARWAKDELRNQDRLFLLGVVLRFDHDRRANKILEAAYQLTGSGDHLLALMSPGHPTSQPNTSPIDNSLPPVPMPPESLNLPKLHHQPIALQ